MHFLSPVDTSLGRSSLFGLALTRAALIGVVGEAASLSIYFLPFLWSGCNIPIGFFWFYKVYSKHLGILSKKLRTQLRSWGFYFFRRRLLSCRQIFFQCTFHGICWGIFFCLIHWSYWRYLLLSLDFCIHPLFSRGGLLVFSSLGSLCKRGSKIIRGTDLQLRLMSQEVFSLPSSFVVMWRGRSQPSLFPSLWRYFLCSRIHSYSSKKNRIK